MKKQLFRCSISKYFTYCVWEIHEIIFRNNTEIIVTGIVLCTSTFIFKSTASLFKHYSEFVAGKAKINSNVILFSQTVCTLYLVINRSCQVWVVGGEGILTNHASRMTQFITIAKGKPRHTARETHLGRLYSQPCSFGHGHVAHECR